MSRVTQLFLDLDGTLVRGDGWKFRSEFFYSLLRELDIRPSLYLKVIHAVKKDLFQGDFKDTNEERIVHAFSKVLQIPFEEGRLRLRNSTLNIFKHMRKYFHPVPGAQEFIKWAGAHYPLYLATNPIWLVEAVHLRLEWGGFDPSIFKAITHVGNMHACKPRKEYFQELLFRENLNPASCLLIGNDPKKDGAAEAVGIRVALICERDSKRSFDKIKNELVTSYA